MKAITRIVTATLFIFCTASAGCAPTDAGWDTTPDERTPTSAHTPTDTNAPPGQPPDAAPKTRPFARIFVQDHSTAALKWADLRIDEKNNFTLGPLADIDGLKPLDPTRQKWVQMKESHRLICAGIRDDADGQFESGWVMIDSGVGYIDHGDHGHWTFQHKPHVIDVRRDTQQGNPAHLYVYNGRFFLANDKLNGYTRLDPTRYEKDRNGQLSKDTPRFIVGGGNHITLAVVNDRVGYSCWIDGGGPNKGRVDVTPITTQPKSEPAYSFYLPTGVIHGATACAGKVFFAPADGICWVEADLDARLKPDQVKIHHISLGTEGDKPRRTGAFTTHGHHVIFTTGKSDNAALAILNAKDAEPKPIFVPLAVKKGTSPTTPEVVNTAWGKDYAFVFHDHAKDVDAEDILDIIALDPNGDGHFTDAKVLKSLKVGKSAVDGHFGHHDIAFDAEYQYAIFTNPGDGTLSLLSLKSLEIVATFPIGGSPGAIVVVGSRETDD